MSKRINKVYVMYILALSDYKQISKHFAAAAG